MNCRENRYIVLIPPLTHWWWRGSCSGQHLKVTKHIVVKISQNAIILSDYTADIPGEAG